MKHNLYLRLLTMAVLSFISMYILMYAMVDRFPNVFSNLNQVYMAGLMAAPMIILELLLMSHMYPDKRANMYIHAASVVALAVFLIGIRQQLAIADSQFLRSMIPHHAGAILMCEKASLSSEKTKDLCVRIIASQRQEIEEMKGLLNSGIQ